MHHYSPRCCSPRMGDPICVTSHYLYLRFTEVPDAGPTVTFRFPGIVKPGTLFHWTMCSPDESPPTIVALFFHLLHVFDPVLTRQQAKDDHCECPTESAHESLLLNLPLWRDRSQLQHEDSVLWKMEQGRFEMDRTDESRACRPIGDGWKTACHDSPRRCRNCTARNRVLPRDIYYQRIMKSEIGCWYRESLGCPVVPNQKVCTEM